MLTLSHLRKVYPNGAVAVEDFSVEVPDGEFLVLVGPSGCGKSTTLRMVAGLEEATAGTIAIDGRVINALPPKDRDLAMVFQNYALYPHMTVRENMGFALRLRRLPKPLIAQRIADAAHALGLDALLDRLPRQLSGGQRQRVALGRALVRQPRLFLFDEPLSNLDAKMRVEMRHEIHRLHLRLRATILSQGFALPELQVTLASPVDPTQTYRVDGIFTRIDGTRVVLEVDGVEKYVNEHMLHGKSTVRALADEQHREAELTLLGMPVLRISSNEAHDPNRVVAKLTAYDIPRDPETAHAIRRLARRDPISTATFRTLRLTDDPLCVATWRCGAENPPRIPAPLLALVEEMAA